MKNNDSLNKLQLHLCELKLEERRVNSEIRSMLNQSNRVDFFQAQKLNSTRVGLKNKIKTVESSIMPNIIA
ncbi:MAG: hypothetical protein PHE89_07325 [Alphaproteobacteria bacterium]|nr:hypothetical protein [Alphaproteobacteria bacterium]